jgi:hypothetical protein
MSKLNFTVEAEVNGAWVHANVATLSEAKLTLSAFEAIDAVDASIHINKDATETAKAEHKQYIFEQVSADFRQIAWLNEQVALGKMTLDNGVYTGNLANF